MDSGVRLLLSRVWLLLVLAFAALVGGCGGCGGDEPWDILDPGSGPANEASLWPLAEGVSWGPDARPLVVSQAASGDGRLITVDLGPLGQELRWIGRRTLDLEETSRGDLVGIEPGGRRYLFVPATVRVGMRWRFTLPFPRGAFVASLGGDLHAGPGYVLYESAAGVYATGVLWRFPALGGPTSPAVWTTPTRVPGLEGAVAIVSGFAPNGEGAPCKLLADRVACPYTPGNPWSTSAYDFGAAPVVRTDVAWVEIPGAFQQGAGVANTLCLARADAPGSLACRGGFAFP